MKKRDKILFFIKNISMGIYSLASSFSLGIINISLSLVLITTLVDRIMNLDFKKYNSKLLVLFFVFSLGILFSFFDSINIKRSIDYIDILIYPLLIIFMITYNSFSIKKIKYFTLLINLSILINIIYGLYQYSVGVRRIEGNVFVMEFATLASFFSIFIILYFINTKIDLKYKFGLFILFILTVLSIIFSGTRGIWIAFPIVILILILLTKKEFMVYFMIFVILVSLFFYFFLPDYYTKRVISIFDLTNNRSNATRILLWKGALLIFRDNPINGVGLNNFNQAIKKDEYYNESMVSTAHAHNNFLQLSAETGFIGLLSFLYLLYNVCNLLLSFIKREDNKLYESYYIAVFGIFILYNLQGLTEYNLEDKYTTFIMWVLISFALILYNNREYKKE